MKSVRELLEVRSKAFKYAIAIFVSLAALSTIASFWEMARWRDTQRFGIVESVSASSLQVRDDRAHRTYLVRVSGDTAVREGTEEGVVDVGDHVMIVGEPSPDGTFDAGLIRIVDFPKHR